jgi:ankyrin repeat protein
MLLVVLAGLAGPGCAKEDLLMHKVDVHEVFADSRVAEMADAIADNDAKRVHALAKSTDLRAHGDKNITLLEWAIFNQSKRAFEALLQEGADPALQGMDGSTAAHLAAMANDSSYFDVLLKVGVDPDLQDKATGQSLLSATLMGDRDAQFDRLLAAGANTNTSDATGDTPLHVAAQTSNYRKVLALLNAGADPRAVNGRKSTFQDYLFMGDQRLLSSDARSDLSSIEQWLRANGIEVKSHN